MACAGGGGPGRWMPDRKRWCIHMRPSYDITWADAGCRMGALGCALVADDVMRMRLCLSSSDVGCFDQKRAKTERSTFLRMHTNLHSMINSTLINSTLINSTLGEERTLLSRQQKQAEQGGGGTFRISVTKGSKHACCHTYLLFITSA